jgi:malate dehydrogenase
MEKKITVVGAGQVGGTTALYLAQKEIADVVLIDVVEGLSEGKALDIMEARPIFGSDVKLTGSTDYSVSEGSDIVIITSGMARKPGMSREDLIDANKKIVEAVTKEVIKYSPNCIIIMVANPLDTMTYLAKKVSGFPKNRVFGQAGILDTARFRTFLAMELNISVEEIQALVLGGHGDEMVPLISYTTVAGIPITHFLSQERIQEIATRTKKAGGEIVALLKTGSAYYSPAAATVQMAEAILKDKKRILPCSAYLEGEYGLQDIYFGVPAKLGAQGLEEVIEVKLTPDEQEAVKRSANAVKNSIATLKL